MSKVHIYTLLNPVTRETAYTTVRAGSPLSEHLSVPDDVIMLRNGLNYEDEVLHDGDVLNLIKVPKGGEQGKSIGRTAIVIGAQLLAASLTGGLSTIASAAIVAGAGVAAGIGANALIPPPSVSGAELGENAQFQRLGSLTGTRNRINAYGAVPKVYGKRKVFPPMSAKPYTEILANEQYMRLLFSVTQGPCQLSKPKIGDTIIGTFNSFNEFTSNGNFEGIRIEVGESPNIYSSTVDEENPGSMFNSWVDSIDDGQVTIKPSNEINDTYTRTTEADVDEISIDLTFPQGLFAIDDNGKTIGTWMHWKVEYSPTGAGTWTEITSANVSDVVKFTEGPVEGWRSTGNVRETWRGGLSWEVDTGTYDVRITRLDGPFTSSGFTPTQIFEEATWTALRSISHEQPTNMDSVVQLGMRIKATDQLNGVLDDFSVEVESRLATYDGSSWSEPTFATGNGTGSGGALTSNPAWIMADILTGDATSRPIAKSRLNAASFKSWADNCDTEGRECNLVIDRSQTILQTAKAIGSTGRGSLALIDGVYKIIQDTEQSTPVQHFTPRNSWGFSSTRTFPDIPHALRVNFVNPDADWETDEATVYDDDYSPDGNKFDEGFGTCAIGSSGTCKIATEFETVDLQGVTSWDQAWKEGRYRLAESRLRPERYTWQADVENIVCNRGDMVRVSHDVTLWGQISGRIKSISGSTLTLDEQVTMESGESYNIRVRTQSGGSEVKTVTTDVGTTSTITVDNTTNLNAGDLFMFGNVGTETQELKILSIEPQGDLTARITAVDAAPDIYDADTGSIPSFDSNITTPVDPEETFNQTPPKPTIVNTRSDVNVLNRDPNGIPELRIVTSYTLGTGAPTQFIDARFKKQGDGQNNWTSFGTVEASAGSVWLYNVEEGDTYIIQIRARSGDESSDWVEASPHEAGANITLPPRERLKAIGELKEDVSGEVTEIAVELDVVIRSGYEYWIVNESELSLNDRFAGIYAFLPLEVGGVTTEYGPGQITLDIDDQYINAPEGSLIFKAPGQEEINQVFNEEIITGVVRVQKEGDIGVLNEEIGSNGTPPGTAKTTIALKEIPATIDLEDNQTLQIYTEAGLIEGMVVNGDQTLTAGTGTITIDSKTFGNYYADGGAKIREPGYSVGSRLTNNITQTSTNITSIASLETHTNIGGGSAFSALTLKSRTDTNENGIATNVSSIATLETHVNLAGGSAYSALNMRSDINTNENTGDTNASAIATLETHVNLAGGSAYTALNMRSDINSNESTGITNASAISSLESHVNLSGGSAYSALTLKSNIDTNEGDITDINATAVLKVDANGNIASVALSANHDGSSINIKGDQVDINNWSFEKANGVLRSTTQVNGNDAIILDGTSGVGTFEDVDIRGGSITGTDISGNVGAIKVVSSLPASGDYEGQVVYLTTDPDNLYRWDGSSWVSTVDGANLIANSVTAGAINVANLSAVNADTGNLTVSGTLLLDGGVIQNSGGNTKFNSSGIILDGSGSFVSASSLTITDGFDDFELYGEGLLNKVFFEANGSWSIELSASGNDIILNSADLHFDATDIGFYGATPKPQDTLSGSSFGGSQVLKDLVVILGDMGLIDNQTSP